MPLMMSFLCCLQAAVLSSSKHKPLLLVAQAAAPSFDDEMHRSSVSSKVILLQSGLFACSLLLATAAAEMHGYYGNSSMNALIKSLAPFVCMLLKGSFNRRRWSAAVVSFCGFLIGLLYAPWPAMLAR